MDPDRSGSQKDNSSDEKLQHSTSVYLKGRNQVTTVDENGTTGTVNEWSYNPLHPCFSDTTGETSTTAASNTGIPILVVVTKVCATLRPLVPLMYITTKFLPQCTENRRLDANRESIQHCGDCFIFLMVGREFNPTNL